MNLQSDIEPYMVLTELSCAYNALEPLIDARTMLLHHREHHWSCVEKLNQVLKPYATLRTRDPLWLLLNLDAMPAVIRNDVRHQLGGHLNHSMFWLAMSPSGARAPQGRLAEAIDRDFGSFEQFKTRFETAGNADFGAGWIWLARAADDSSRLRICSTSAHDNPVRHGLYPILLNDVREHAYYLKHQSARGNYLHEWWAVVDWRQAEQRFDAAESMGADVLQRRSSN